MVDKLEQSKYWCFTWHSHTENGDGYLDIGLTPMNKVVDYFTDFFNDKMFTYVVVGFEECPTTGRLHLQGYIEFDERKRRTQIKCKKFLLHVSDLERRYKLSSSQKCSDYCKKDGSFFELGEMSVLNKGKAQTYVNLRDTIKENPAITKKELFDTDASYASMGKTVDALMNAYQEHRKDKPIVEWYYGKSGSGKSHYAFTENPNSFPHTNTQWNDGLQYKDTMIFDDLRITEHFPFRELLRVLDKYPMSVQIKGGIQKFNQPKIVITTPFHPSHLVPYGENPWQLMRRIDKLYLVKNRVKCLQVIKEEDYVFDDDDILLQPKKFNV